LTAQAFYWPVPFRSHVAQPPNCFTLSLASSNKFNNLNMSMTAASAKRRLIFVAALITSTVPVLALAQTPIKKIGVFALLGDGLQVVSSADETIGTRLDRNQRDSLTTRGIGLDQAALRAVRAGVERLQPRTQLSMYRATAPISIEEQREVVEGAQRSELPGWVVNAINADKLTHVLLITSGRGQASFPVAEGFTLGTGNLEGVGLYIDRANQIMNRSTGVLSNGFIGPYAMLRLTLMDTTTGEVTKTYDIRDSSMYTARSTDVGNDPWNYLSATDKVEKLRELVEGSVGRVVGAVLP